MKTIQIIISNDRVRTFRSACTYPLKRRTIVRDAFGAGKSYNAPRIIIHCQSLTMPKTDEIKIHGVDGERK